MTERATGRPRAATEAQQRAHIRAAFLRFYDRDPEFREGLESLIPKADAADIVTGRSSWKTAAGLWRLSDHDSGQQASDVRLTRINEITAFADAADEVASRFGLDRLGLAGREQILSWCERHLRARTAGSAHPSTYGAGRFSTTPGHIELEPDVSGLIGPPWVMEGWDPIREPRRDARVRLERLARDHIKAALDRIEADAAASGMTVADTAPNQDRDLGWLFRKVRFRETFQDIFNSLDEPPDGGVDTVRMAVIRMARRVGVDTAGWETGWR